LYFGASKDWKKQRSESGTYWYSDANKMSIALSSKQLFAASWLGFPASPIASSLLDFPAGFAEFRQGSLLSFWVEDAGPKISGILANGGIPLQLPAQRLFIDLFPAEEGQYEAVIRLQFADEKEAGSLAALFTAGRFFLRNFVLDETNPNSAFIPLFFTNPPVQDGQNLDIKTPLLTEKEIALLFKMFLL
jgi:hypothetical protein